MWECSTDGVHGDRNRKSLYKNSVTRTMLQTIVYNKFHYIKILEVIEQLLSIVRKTVYKKAKTTDNNKPILIHDLPPVSLCELLTVK